jgi:hypothetical protein
MTLSYPPISDVTLVPIRTIDLLLKEHPDALSRPDCPYPAHIRTFLARILDRKLEKVAVVEVEMDLEQLGIEISALYQDIRETLKVEIADPKDKVAVIKTGTEQLNRLIGLREKVMNLREMSEFQRAVMEVLEQVVTPAQRSEFVERLAKYVQ